MKFRYKDLQFDFERCIYIETNKGKIFTDYEYIGKIEDNAIRRQRLDKSLRQYLTEIVRVEQFKNYSKAQNTQYYFILRDSVNWKRCTQLTGLREQFKNTYFGDDGRKGRSCKNLIVFHFISGYLIVDYSIGFYPYNEKVRMRFLEELKKTLPTRSALTDIKTHQLDLFNAKIHE